MLTPSDKKYDRHQTAVMPGKYEAIGAQDLRRLMDLILNCVQAGQGIRIERRGQRVYVHATGATAGRGMGGGVGGDDSYVRIVYGSSKAGLVEPPGPNYIARVDSADEEDGMTCVPNADRSGWDAFTHFE